MARYTYTGKLTNFGRTPFPASANVELRVLPVQSGYGGDGLLSDRTIPVTVDSDGSFSVRLESSASVRPEALYKLQARWLASPDQKSWSDWVVFRAAAGGGNIAELAELPTPAWAIAYGFGPPPEHLRSGLYIDIQGEKAVLYGPQGGRF